MLRYVLNSMVSSSTGRARPGLEQTRSLSGRGGSGVDEKDYDAAREWLNDFKPSQIDRKLGTMTWSRSSGAGGQHVNT